MLAFAAKRAIQQFARSIFAFICHESKPLFKFFVPHTTTQMPFSGASRHIALCRPSLVYTQNPSRYIAAVAKRPAACLPGKRPEKCQPLSKRGEKDEA
ncbi:TPA: hypothetical protein PCO46_000039 [Klebsiella quasipneumoniae subsp. similipneumoniae]|uniref:hypothetical protein n=1 Tax=Klebsiella quasipneumoniae TaxID=1463165 RepID=UPI0007CA51CD|nr:hypothetical protein [Klebsiella quasipneumoniae]SAZ34825.1 conserved hypothetical protein [Klebsiella quasipneumoniae subsp. similipneumoniae]HDG8059570.1 hypothetical protein [Klebsiella quasipneumoniae subsp. similipneumoniae]